VDDILNHITVFPDTIANQSVKVVKILQEGVSIARSREEVRLGDGYTAFSPEEV